MGRKSDEDESHLKVLKKIKGQQKRVYGEKRYTIFFLIITLNILNFMIQDL